MSDAILLQGDCLELLKELPDNSVDSLVTDPPAGISFMGKEWDNNKGGSMQWISWLTDVMKEALRVLKPGAHGLVWAIPRTSHWTATALENAGFEIRDVVTHIFGSGFPKSLDISKAIDKAAGAEREVISKTGQRCGVFKASGSGTPQNIEDYEAVITAPSTPEAKQWQGYGTALKPASEHWILVRKPCSEKTVAANVLKHGTGGINIDASRIFGKPRTTHSNGNFQSKTKNTEVYGEFGLGYQCPEPQGRFPSNLVISHNPDCVEVVVKKVKGISTGTPMQMNNKVYGEYDESYEGTKPGYKNPDGTETVPAFECTPGCAVAALDEQSGELKGPWGKNSKEHVGKDGETSIFKMGGVNSQNELRGKETGGASRFFYCAKASKKDKGKENTHPTVKSSTLMSYLITMITPPNGIVLDPFMGSGSTGVSAKKLNMSFIGIEKEIEYFNIANERINT